MLLMVAADKDARELAVYDFSLMHEILIAAAALLVLLGVTHRGDLGYWSWSLYSQRKRDRVVACGLLAFQSLVVATLAAIVPVVHHVAGVRPVSLAGLALLVVEAVLAGWAACALIPGSVTRHQDSAPELLRLAAQSVAGALDARACDCVRPCLRMAMSSSASSSVVLAALCDAAEPKDRAAAELVASHVAATWQRYEALPGDLQRQADRERAMNGLVRYVTDARVAPHRIVARR